MFEKKSITFTVEYPVKDGKPTGLFNSSMAMEPDSHLGHTLFCLLVGLFDYIHKEFGGVMLADLVGSALREVGKAKINDAIETQKAFDQAASSENKLSDDEQNNSTYSTF